MHRQTPRGVMEVALSSNAATNYVGGTNLLSETNPVDGTNYALVVTIPAR